MKEDFQGYFLGLEGGVGRVEDGLAIVPAGAELGHDIVRLLQAKPGDGRFERLVDELA